MKKIIVMLMIIMLVSIFFCGCIIKSNDQQTSLVVSDDSGDAGSIPNEIIVQAGNKFEFGLESNPTTGYTWIADIENEELLNLVSSEYTAEGEKDAAGSGGITTLVFQALKAGETTLTLTYAQDWEGGETDKEKTITITIQ